MDHSGPTSSRMPKSTPDRVCRVSSRLFAVAVSHCSATLRVCQIMYRPEQFCTWHALSETEFHPTQTGAYHGAVLPSPGCTRFVQTVVCPLETPSTAPSIGTCGERMLRPPRPRVDDDDDSVVFEMNLSILDKCWDRAAPSICQWRRVVCESCFRHRNCVSHQRHVGQHREERSSRAAVSNE